jgi:hypothetical protein
MWRFDDRGRKGMTMTRRSIAALLTSCILTVAAGASVITGTVVNMTEGGTPVADQAVVLQQRMMGQEAPELTATSDANGKFQFNRIQSEPGRLFRLRTNFAGQVQTSDAFHAAEGDMDHRLVVHDTVSSPDHIAVEKLHLILEHDQAGNAVKVVSVYVVENWRGIYVGSQNEDGRDVVQFDVPENAYDFQIMQGNLAMHHRVTPSGFVSTLPFYPGSDTLVYQYRIALDGSEAKWDVQSQYPITSLNVISMAGQIEIDLEGGEEAPSPMGQQLINLERMDIPAGEHVRISVDSGAVGTGGVARWLIVVAAVALAIVVVFAVYVRAKQRTTEPDADADAGSGGSQVVESSGDADTLVAEIAELDTQYERGEVSEQDYVSKRRELKQQLIEAVRREG